MSQTCELEYVQPEMLSAFGELVEKLRKERGIAKSDLAEMASVSRGKLTESMRDREWAKENGKRWYGPDLDAIDLWADAFGLKGQERRRFFDLAHLAHATPYLRSRFDQMEKGITRQKSALFGLLQTIKQCRNEIPKAVAERLLASIENLED